MPDNAKNPFEGVTDFFSELSRMRELGTSGGSHSHEDKQRTHARAWVPATDIFARDEDLVIRVELSGVEPANIEITFSHGVLSVSGERQSELGAGSEDSFYIRERFYGAFRRAITLPEGTDDSQIEAEFENGLVELTVRGGATGAEPKRIALRARSAKAT